MIRRLARAAAILAVIGMVVAITLAPADPV